MNARAARRTFDDGAFGGVTARLAGGHDGADVLLKQVAVGGLPGALSA